MRTGKVGEEVSLKCLIFKDIFYLGNQHSKKIRFCQCEHPAVTLVQLHLWPGSPDTFYYLFWCNQFYSAIDESNDMTPVQVSRKRFRPTPQELEILKADHLGDYRGSMAARAVQFGVTEKQTLQARLNLSGDIKLHMYIYSERYKLLHSFKTRPISVICQQNPWMLLFWWQWSKYL